jgi:hypothetical protein
MDVQAPERSGRLRRGHPVRQLRANNGSSLDLMVLTQCYLKSAEFSVLFCIFSLPGMITRTAVGEPQVRRKPVISRNGRLTGRFSLPFLRSLPVSAFLSNPLLTRVPSGACRSLFYAAPSLIFSRIPRKWVPSRNSYSPCCKTRISIIWGFPLGFGRERGTLECYLIRINSASPNQSNQFSPSISLPTARNRTRAHSPRGAFATAITGQAMASRSPWYSKLKPE